MKKTSVLKSTDQIETPDNKKLSEVLIRLMDECDIDALELERRTGVPSSTINRYRSEKTCNPTLASLTPLANFFCITVSQLIGEEPLGDRPRGIYRSTLKAGAPVPILNWEDTATLANSQHILEHNTGKWITLSMELGPDAFSLAMQGDSMEPRFPDGTLLIFDPSQIANNRDFVLVYLANTKKPVFRQIVLDGFDKYLKCLNPEFKDLRKMENNDKVLGVLVQARMDFKDMEHD
jgi:SOS-response transcriptional repressor LexA